MKFALLFVAKFIVVVLPCFYDLFRQVDSVGRSRWKTPRSGNLFFFLRKESNPLTDAWDIAKCFKGSKKPVGVVVVDNCVGPS